MRRGSSFNFQSFGVVINKDLTNIFDDLFDLENIDLFDSNNDCAGLNEKNTVHKFDYLLKLFDEDDYSKISKLLFNSNYSDKYKEFTIYGKKARDITSPQGKIRKWQNILKLIICDKYRPRKSVHGFVKNRSILTNAKEHLRKRYILNIDLKNFYKSITFPRVRGMFIAKPFNYSPEISTILAQLCTYKKDMSKDLPFIPLGAPTSPCIANIIASKLDKDLLQLARKYKVTYTRYADDITFSTTRKEFPAEIAYFTGCNPVSGEVFPSEKLLKSIKSNGFALNDSKTRMSISGRRHEVTGLVVNEFPNVKRDFIKSIRGMLNAWEKYGLKKAENTYRHKYLKYDGKRRYRLDEDKKNYENVYFFREALYGKLAYLKMIRGETDLYIRLCLRAIKLDRYPPKSILSMKSKYEKYDVFISHASEDKESVAIPIYEECKKIGITPFLDIKYLKEGDSLTEKINLALGESKIFLAILSDITLSKNWPRREINAAISRRTEGKQKFIPVVIGSPNLDHIALTNDLLRFEWKNNSKAIAQKLKMILLENKN